MLAICFQNQSRAQGHRTGEGDEESEGRWGERWREMEGDGGRWRDGGREREMGEMEGDTRRHTAMLTGIIIASAYAAVGASLGILPLAPTVL